MSEKEESDLVWALKTQTEKPRIVCQSEFSTWLLLYKGNKNSLPSHSCRSADSL